MAGNLTAMIAAAFAGSAVVSDEYFEYTTLLLPGNGTNGAQNNTFLDGSTNNFTITRNGNTTQGTFSPFSQTGWGNRFNFATPDALRPSATTISNFGTGAFTVEFWINFQNTNNAGIYYGGNGGGSVFLDYYSGSLRWGISGGAIPISYAFTPTIGRWYHVAFTRSSTTDTLYINGTSVATGPDSQNYPSDSSPYVGSWNGSIYNGTAFISNFRIVKGVTVYTGAFTPPTSPLTATQSAGTNIAAITTGQTSLLTCQSNRFVDNGQGNTGNTGFTITVNGSPSVQAFSPFNPTASWSAATNGGSGYFDGTGDYLTTPNVTALNLYNVTNTVECWVYPLSFSTLFQLYGTDLDGTYYTIFDILDTSGYPRYMSRSGSAITGSSGITLNQWNHVAFGRSGSTQSIWVNGIRVASGTITTEDQWGTAVITIGRFNATSRGNGYLSSLRVVKGTDVYGVSNTTITVPTAPLTAITNTSLLLNFTNAGIYDATSKNDLETVGNAQISTTQSKWGSGSMYFDGTGDWLLIPDQPIQRIGTGNFTIEGWVYRNSSGTYGFIGKGTGTTGWLVSLNSSNQVVFTYGSSTITSTGTVSATTWTHIAVVREGTSTNQTKIYINGTNDGTGTVSTDFNQTNSMYVGADRTGGSAANAYMQDVRVTNYARYTTNFTAPTAAFPTL